MRTSTILSAVSIAADEEPTSTYTYVYCQTVRKKEQRKKKINSRHTGAVPAEAGNCSAAAPSAGFTEEGPPAVALSASTAWWFAGLATTGGFADGTGVRGFGTVGALADPAGAGAGSATASLFKFAGCAAVGAGADLASSCP